MGARKHTKESVIQLLQNLAKQLGRTNLSKRDVQPHIAESSLRNVFGSLGKALQAAGLESNPSSIPLSGYSRLSDDELWRNLVEVESIVGREPTTGDSSANGSVSNRPYLDRWGKWSNAMAHYRKWKAENGVVPGRAEAPGEPISSKTVQSHPAHVSAAHRTPTASVAAHRGEPIHFRNLLHAPINEGMVILLFGMISAELGFKIVHVQAAFPDCEAMQCVDAKTGRWQTVRIEFELRSWNFFEHGHDASACDLVVCWEHDWDECPLPVIELRSEILKLRAS